MNKYDFGYELEKNSSNYWAFQKIRRGSKVLEIGSSNGRLTKHLKEELDCIVDIIEINEEAGAAAAVFARRAFLGIESGNIESSDCLDQLSGEDYDYIVFLDVLEHLVFPEKALKEMHSLLREEGSILISIPNIAYNSIIINLLKNKFEYTNLGILDDTHLHYYTWRSFTELAHKAGYRIAENSAIQRLVGDTEIKNSYEDIPKTVASFLRTRDQADVYQLLFELKKSGEDCPALKVTNLDYTLYTAQAYWGESCDSLELKKRYFIDPHTVHLEIEPDRSESKLRVDLLNTNCVIADLRIIGYDVCKKEYEINVENMNGVEITQGMYAFEAKDPQIYFSAGIDVIRIDVFYNCLLFDTDVFQYFSPVIKEKIRLENELGDERNHNHIYAEEYQKLLQTYEKTNKQKEDIEQKYHDLEAQYHALEKEYLALYDNKNKQ